jgi:hypothetical protein
VVGKGPPSLQSRARPDGRRGGNDFAALQHLAKPHKAASTWLLEALATVPPGPSDQEGG